ncbi:O-antigen ligase family protein [Flavobacterium daejeonense]|uniref:O-antigen ligase family protein n=1 Tax=Flavobacterium daejeonense TaxID=350893 RepID=UPI00047ECF2F|nr:O-antigen ligase family protein [Flavobacterium daejeonense]
MIKNYSEKPFLNISQAVCFIVSFLLLLGCLLNFEIFLYSSLFNYFVLVLGSGVILTFILFLLFKVVKSDVKIDVTLPFILFIIWALFVFLQHGEAVQYKYYRIAACFVFISSFIVLRKDNSISFYKAVAVVATIEAIWCVLQYLGKIPSEDVNFKVTGSFSNPNVVAMFLALSIPALLYFFIKPTTVYKKAIYSLMLLIVCVGLLLLECRTALLGAVFSSGLFLILHFNSIRRFKRKYLFFGFLAVGILSIPIGKQLYLHKKDSADGRLLIWRITTQMVLDSPVRGYGTGMFEREYNLRQAKAIQENKLSQKELKNASFVLMAYNDYLEQAVQGGIPAVLLFVLMIASFFISE